MRSEPSDLAPHQIVAALAAHWGVESPRVEYSPVGFGSYHWIAWQNDGKKLFVTADRLVPDGSSGTNSKLSELEAAYETAFVLQREFGFVVAPLPNKAGRLVVRLGNEWAVGLFPFLDGEAAGAGRWTSLQDASEAAGIIARLHQRTAPACLDPFSFEVPHRETLFDDLDRRWSTGPYGEPTRQLLLGLRGNVEVLLAHYDGLVARILNDPEPWVISHGEPHSANFIRRKDGLVSLIDWDTVRLAPRERDLAALPIEEPDVLHAYQEVAGPVTPRAEALELFRAWWDISEICIYTHRYRQAHEHSADDEISWPGLKEYIDVPARWPKLAAT